MLYNAYTRGESTSTMPVVGSAIRKLGNRMMPDDNESASHAAESQHDLDQVLPSSFIFHRIRIQVSNYSSTCSTPYNACQPQGHPV